MAKPVRASLTVRRLSRLRGVLAGPVLVGVVGLLLPSVSGCTAAKPEPEIEQVPVRPVSGFWGDATSDGWGQTRLDVSALTPEASALVKTPGLEPAEGDGDASDQRVRAVLPHMAPLVLRTYLLPQARYEALYDEMASEPLRRRLSREEFAIRLQDHYDRVLAFSQLVVMGDNRDIRQRHDRVRGLAAFILRSSSTMELGRDPIWGMSFRRERGEWKLDEIRPDFLTPLTADEKRRRELQALPPVLDVPAPSPTTTPVD